MIERNALSSDPPYSLTAEQPETELIRIAIADDHPAFRDGLYEILQLEEGFRALGFSIGGSESQILPLVVGDAEKCMAFSERLLDNGIFVQGIRPPTVPEGTSRLRVTAMATHTHEHLHRALDAFEQARKQF